MCALKGREQWNVWVDEFHRYLGETGPEPGPLSPSAARCCARRGGLGASRYPGWRIRHRRTGRSGQPRDAGRGRTNGSVPGHDRSRARHYAARRGTLARSRRTDRPRSCTAPAIRWPVSGPAALGSNAVDAELNRVVTGSDNPLVRCHELDALLTIENAIYDRLIDILHSPAANGRGSRRSLVFDTGGLTRVRERQAQLARSTVSGAHSLARPYASRKCSEESGG